ncbi:flagellar biosynthesis protein FlhF [candidate division KSB1 bacterium]
MRIKKFVAPSMKEAMAKMKEELGSDALILKSNKVKAGGMLEFMGKEVFEVLAAVDKDAPVSKPESPGLQVANRQASAVAAYSTAPAVSVAEAPASSTGVYTSQKTFKKDTEKIQFTLLQAELSELKQDIEEVGHFIKYKNVPPSLPENLQIVMKQLMDNDVHEPIARDLVEDIHRELKGSEYNDLRMIVAMALQRIEAKLKVVPGNVQPLKGPRIVTLIGPTGVGKTTTIAKLATNQKLLNKKKVALISADTFRIGAVDQLKTFANIADIPLEVVYRPEDMKKALRKFREMDVIYIDTTGRSQRDKARLKDLKNYISEMNPHETHLCLSVTSKFNDLVDAAERFSIMKYNRIILTKLDETTSLGVILNLANKLKTPLAFLTSGQNVPEDIERASTEKLSKMIVRRKSN